MHSAPYLRTSHHTDHTQTQRLVVGCHQLSCVRPSIPALGGGRAPHLHGGLVVRVELAVCGVVTLSTATPVQAGVRVLFKVLGGAAVALHPKPATGIGFTTNTNATTARFRFGLTGRVAGLSAALMTCLMSRTMNRESA